MTVKKLLALYGLKWNPFSQDIPLEAIHKTAALESFCYSIENMVYDGGYALLTGESGTGKSVALRALDARLAEIREIVVGTITRPQSNLLDFYREISSLFSIDLKTSNRWGSFASLRKKWQDQIKSTLLRPVLLIDEAQEMDVFVLSELRFLVSSRFDSCLLMTIVLCGDNRMLEKLKTSSLVPLGSRIRIRQIMEPATKDDLKQLLSESIRKAGNSSLMTTGLVNTLAEHSLGNYRVMMNMANTLLNTASQRELKELDEKLYLDIFQRTERPKLSHGRLQSRA